MEALTTIIPALFFIACGFWLGAVFMRGKYFPLVMTWKHKAEELSAQIGTFTTPEANAVIGAFNCTFGDGSPELYSALPTNLLLEEYRSILGQFDKANGNAEKIASLIGQVMLIQMEMSCRLADLTHNPPTPRPPRSLR